MPNDRPTSGPQVARVAIETLRQARALCDPALHTGDRREAAERACRALDYLIDQARWNGEPL
jgi:hypothetical protein